MCKENHNTIQSKRIKYSFFVNILIHAFLSLKTTYLIVTKKGYFLNYNYFNKKNMTITCFYLTSVSAILSLLIWVWDEWNMNTESKKYYRMFYPVIFGVLSFISILKFSDLDKVSTMEKEAATIYSNMNSIKSIITMSRGEKMAVVMTDSIFLEKHKELIPNTYNDFENLKRKSLYSYPAPLNSMDTNMNDVNIDKELSIMS
jgi:hypothetical protein